MTKSPIVPDLRRRNVATPFAGRPVRTDRTTLAGVIFSRDQPAGPRRLWSSTVTCAVAHSDQQGHAALPPLCCSAYSISAWRRPGADCSYMRRAGSGGACVSGARLAPYTLACRQTSTRAISPHASTPVARYTGRRHRRSTRMKTAKLVKRFRVEKPEKFKLARWDPSDTCDLDIEKDDAKAFLAQGIERLSDLQERLYAQDRWALLVIFQAMDTAGKDSAIKHVMS